MKRYILSRKNIPAVSFEIQFNYEIVDNVKSSVKVYHPISINHKFRLTDDQLRTYNDLIESMIAPLVKRKFIINNEWQSKKSYAYYVDFYPVDREGNRLSESVRMIFRASDHDIKHGDEGHVSEDVILKSFTLLGKKYKDPFSLQKKVIDICEHLQDGDLMYVASSDT